MAKIQVVFYSMYGHVYQLAEAVAEGARGVAGAQVELLRVPELMDQAALEKSGAKQAQQAFAHLPLASPDKLIEADAIILGTPTRFGNMAAQMRSFWDETGGLWMKGALIGKLAASFVGTGTQHGGHETTHTSIWNTFAHHGMIIVPLGYSEPKVLNMAEITGGGPYGAGTMSNVDGSRQPSGNELDIARTQGAQVAQLAVRLFG
jgi:NAD(P)H dehydrogenase (quinone)